MSFQLPCPKCGQIFKSDISLYLHYDNAHSTRKWVHMFAEVVGKSKQLLPEDAQVYTDIETNVVSPLTQEECARKNIARKKKDLDDYIKKEKEKAKANKE